MFIRSPLYNYPYFLDTLEGFILYIIKYILFTPTYFFPLYSPSYSALPAELEVDSIYILEGGLYLDSIEHRDLEVTEGEPRVTQSTSHVRRQTAPYSAAWPPRPRHSRLRCSPHHLRHHLRQQLEHRLVRSLTQPTAV